MKLLEIRTDVFVDNIYPHTFLFVYEEGKKDQGVGYGFSNTEGDFKGPGQVKIETDHKYHESLTRTIQITDTQYQTLMENIEVDKNTPPKYDIRGGAQCTTWAMDQLNKADIIESDVSFGAANSFTALVETIQTNPYTQGVEQFKINVEPQWIK